MFGYKHSRLYACAVHSTVKTNRPHQEYTRWGLLIADCNSDSVSTLSEQHIDGRTNELVSHFDDFRFDLSAALDRIIDRP
jgi:hypothetical protein